MHFLKEFSKNYQLRLKKSIKSKKLCLVLENT